MDMAGGMDNMPKMGMAGGMNNMPKMGMAGGMNNMPKMGMAGGRRSTRGKRSGRSRRGTRKVGGASCRMAGGARKASAWNKMVKAVYTEMRRKNKSATFGEALKEASRRKKRGSK